MTMCITLNMYLINALICILISWPHIIPWVKIACLQLRPDSSFKRAFIHFKNVLADSLSGGYRSFDTRYLKHFESDFEGGLVLKTG